MKNDLIWTKTVLSVYRYLERICGSIDKVMLKSALGSGNVLGKNLFFNNVVSISNKLIDLSERKVTLINLKVLLEDVFKSIKVQDARLLIERYVTGKKCKDIALKHDISIRTVFRKINAAEISFCKRLKFLGFDSAKIESMLESEGWILSAYDQFSQKNIEEISFETRYLDRVASL